MEFLFSQFFECMREMREEEETDDWLITTNLYNGSSLLNEKSFEKFKKSRKTPIDYEILFISVLKNIIENLEERKYDGKVKNEKCNTMALETMNRGNKMFMSGTHRGITASLKSYTRSILDAYPGSQELALSYNNRSVVFLQMGRLK